MKRQSLERILAERGAKKGREALDLADGEVATLLVGAGPVHPVPGVVRIALADDYLVATTRKGATVYVEHDALRAITFEPTAIADRRTGF